jgi:hypothetical protein
MGFRPEEENKTVNDLDWVPTNICNTWGIFNLFCTVVLPCVRLSSILYHFYFFIFQNTNHAVHCVLCVRTFIYLLSPCLLFILHFSKQRIHAVFFDQFSRLLRRRFRRVQVTFSKSNTMRKNLKIY